jgi:radical SAM/Cys-rich protein
MALPTLLNRAHLLAPPAAQRACLDALRLPVQFEHAAARAGHAPLRALAVSVLQMNLGKRCNQACRHCHVDAGPDRREVMTPEIVEACLRVLEHWAIPVLDVTGGAPELHPQFREIVGRARALGRRVMDRCNLTVTRLPNYRDLPQFLAHQRVEVVASLPAWTPTQTDRQRGDGVFDASVDALREFNALGYGREGSGLILNLVTNPVGAFLPGNQRSLEAEWKRELAARYGIAFNRLYTMTNMPISRFLAFLVETGNLEGYMARLVGAFNPGAVDGLMCRYTLSVGWDGRVYDCDFNQMIEMPLGAGAPVSILDVERDALHGRSIATGPHCFGCTAGAGSSCGGTIA